MEELLEKERQDRIDIKKDHRDGIKQRWKDMQRAQALTNKVLEQRGIMDDSRRKALAVQDGDVEDEENGEAPVTTTFDREEDDPFGDCEVTTTAFEAPNASGGGLAANAAKLWPALQHTNMASSWMQGSRGTWDAEGDEAAAAQFARQRRRAVVKKQEEKRQHDALQRRVAKKLGLKKKGGRKTTTAKGTNSGKSGHNQRKKQAKLALKKAKPKT